MAKGTEHLKTIESLTRLRNSSSGNPRYQITFTDGTVAKTKRDASFAYGLENPENTGVLLRVKMTSDGEVSDVTPVDPDSVTSEGVNQ